MKASLASGRPLAPGIANDRELRKDFRFDESRADRTAEEELDLDDEYAELSGVVVCSLESAIELMRTLTAYLEGPSGVGHNIKVGYASTMHSHSPGLIELQRPFYAIIGICQGSPATPSHVYPPKSGQPHPPNAGVICQFLWSVRPYPPPRTPWRPQRAHHLPLSTRPNCVLLSP